MSGATIREARADDFPRVLPLLREFRNEQLTDADWHRLFEDHSGVQGDTFGYVLEDAGEVVGFIAAIRSEREVRGERLRFVNASSWIVRDAYRAHSLPLFVKLLADRQAVVTNLSPTPQVLEMMLKLGFTRLDMTQRILVPSLAGLFGKARVVTGRAALERELTGEPLRFLRDHDLPFHRHALVRAPEGSCYLMANRSSKQVRRGLRLPFARVHHVSAPDVLVRHAPQVALRLALAFGVVGVVVDERMLGGAVPAHSRPRPGGARTAAYRSKVVEGTDVDGLYTESVLLNF